MEKKKIIEWSEFQRDIFKNILYARGYKKFEKEKFNLVASICRVISICKGAIIDTPSKMDEILDTFDIDTFGMDRDEFISVVCQVLRKCKEIKDVVDFNDM